MRRNWKAFITPNTAGEFSKLGRYLKHARVARNLTLDTASERAGIGRATIARIERGDPSVATGAFVAYLNLLGLLPQFTEALSPERDRIGEHLRSQQIRKRPRAPSDSRLRRYDF